MSAWKAYGYTILESCMGVPVPPYLPRKLLGGPTYLLYLSGKLLKAVWYTVLYLESSCVYLHIMHRYLYLPGKLLAVPTHLPVQLLGIYM